MRATVRTVRQTARSLGLRFFAVTIAGRDTFVVSRGQQALHRTDDLEESRRWLMAWGSHVARQGEDGRP